MRNTVRLILVFIALLIILVTNVGAQNNEICYCHNVNNNPHTICTANEAQVQAHSQHVNNGTDLFGRCEDVLITPTATPAPTSTSAPTATAVPTATFTDVPPTATSNPTPTNIPPSPTFTSTAIQIPPTNTSIPPSFTPDPTPTGVPPSPTATSTEVPPSPTPDPTPTNQLTNTLTSTPTLEVTNTPLPSTATPTLTVIDKPTNTPVPEETPDEPTPTPLPETGGGISCSTPERVTIRVVTGIEGDGKLTAFWTPSGEGDYALIRWATTIEGLELAQSIRTEDDGVYEITGLQQVHYWVQVQAADDDCGGLWSEPYDPLP